MLPGLAPAVASPLLPFRLVGAVTAFSTTLSQVDISSVDILAGDLGVFFDYARGNSAAPANVVPSGHTQIGTTSGGFGRGTLSAKILTGGESVLSGMTANICRNIYAVFRFSEAVSGFTIVGFTGQVTNNDPTAQSISASGTSSYPILLLAHMACYAANITSRSTSPAMDEIENGKDSNLGQYAYFRHYDTGAANHTVDMGDSGNENCLQSCYLRVTL